MKGRGIVNRGARQRAARPVIYGVHAVGQWLRSEPARVQRVYYDGRAGGRLRDVIDASVRAGIPLETMEKEGLLQLAGSPRHQGLVAAVGPFPYGDFHQVVRRRDRLLLALDQVQDPHNLGAMLRTAAATGVGAVIVPRDGTAGVTAAVEAAAAGAAALVPVCRVTNLVRALATLKEEGYWCIGLDPTEGTNLFALEKEGASVLVVGGEAGMRRLIGESCDRRVSIPMVRGVESLNTSVAAAVALYHLSGLGDGPA